MFILLPIVFISIYIYQKKSLLLKGEGIWEAFASSLLIFQAVLLLITNILSFFHCLNTITLIGSWLIVLIIIWTIYLIRFGFSFPLTTRLLNQIFEHYMKRICSFSISEKLMLISIAVIAMILFIGAIFTVPYNYDSMTYHLARIGHWIDNQSVNHFVTTIDRQLYSPVLDEYNLLHMFLLTGSDSFLNLLQYFSMLITAAYLYKCTKMLGTGRCFSIFAAFLFMTMPLTISQAVTTQNDLFGTMWFAVFLYYLLQFVLMDTITFKSKTIRMALFTGLTVGCAFLTKTSICASMVFFLPWLVIVRFIKKDKLIALIKTALTAGTALFVFISESLVRNFLSCGQIMPATASDNIMVATKNISYIIVNIMKNFSLIVTQHFSDALNGFICRIAIHTGALLKVEVNHEAISFHGFDYIRHMNRGSNMYSHDITPSAFVGYLALGCGFLLIIFACIQLFRKKIKSGTKPLLHPHTLGFSISCWLSLGFIMALLRWQPWGTRIMYPALAMTVIMIGNLFDIICRNMKKKGYISIPFIILGILFAIPSITYNMEPSMTNIAEGCSNRLSRYFTYNKRYDSYLELTDALAEFEASETIGVSISGDGYDYPLWLTFKKYMPQYKLVHIVLDTPSKADVNLKYILKIERGETKLGETMTYNNQLYTCVFVSNNNEDAIFSAW